MEPLKNCYVYAHYRKNTDQIFYVGRGTHRSSKRQGKYARARTKNGRNPHWKNIVAKFGFRMEILFDNLTFEESQQIEIEQIALHKREVDGGPLCNLTVGGDGNEGNNNTLQDIYDNIYPEPNTGCWIWSGVTDFNSGRPAVYIAKENRPGHRYIYEVEKSIKLDRKIFLINSCGCNLCVNPDHHYQATQKERGFIKALRIQGTKHYSAKLTEDDVRMIRHLYETGKCNGTELQNKYNLRPGTIYPIIHRKTWKHVV